MARVVRNKYTGKTKGYGFVSFLSAEGMKQAFLEMDGKHIGGTMGFKFLGVDFWGSGVCM